MNKFLLFFGNLFAESNGITHVSLDIHDNFTIDTSIMLMQHKRSYPKFSSIDIVDYEANLSTLISPNSLHSIQKYFENLDEVKGEGKVLDDKLIVASLFYKALLEKSGVEEGAYINVSTHDYYSKEQNENLFQVFKNIGLHTKVVPESLAAIIVDVLLLKEDTTRNFTIINCRGSKVTKTIYEIIVKDKNFTINYKNTSNYNIPSDFDIESIVAESVIGQLNRSNIDFYPYQKNNSTETEYYSDLKPYVLEIIKSLTIENKFKEILGIEYLTKSTNKKYTIVGPSFNLDEIRTKIRETIKNEDLDVLLKDILADYSNNTSVYILSNYNYLGNTLNHLLVKNFNKIKRSKSKISSLIESISQLGEKDTSLFTINVIEPSSVIDGLNLIFDSKFTLNDSRIIINGAVESKYSELVAFIKNWKKFKNTEEFKKENKFLKDKDFDLIPSLDISEYETFESMKNLNDTYKKLGELNNTRNVNSYYITDGIKNLEKALEDVKVFMKTLSEEMRAIIQVPFEETKLWYEENKNNDNIVREFGERSVRLMANKNMIISRINNIKKKEIDEIREKKYLLEFSNYLEAKKLAKVKEVVKENETKVGESETKENDTKVKQDKENEIKENEAEVNQENEPEVEDILDLTSPPSFASFKEYYGDKDLDSNTNEVFKGFEDWLLNKKKMEDFAKMKEMMESFQKDMENNKGDPTKGGHLFNEKLAELFSKNMKNLKHEEELSNENELLDKTKDIETELDEDKQVDNEQVADVGSARDVL